MIDFKLPVNKLDDILFKGLLDDVRKEVRFKLETAMKSVVEEALSKAVNDLKGRVSFETNRSTENILINISLNNKNLVGT